MKKTSIPIAWICFSISIIFILCITLLTREQMISRKYILVPFHSYYEMIVHHRWGWLSQDLLNMTLFVPLGMTGYLVTKRSAGKTVLIGALLSAFVETTQYLTKLGFFETDDIINNTIGTAVGATLSYFILKIIYNYRK